MKKLFCIFAIVVSTIFSSLFINAQSSTRNALVLTGGLSQITGYGGIEFYSGIASIDAGVGTLTSGLNGESETTLGIGLSFYDSPENTSSFYSSIGWTQNGAVYDYWDSMGNAETKWANTWTVLLGFRLAGEGILSLKAGGGYSWSEYINSWTFEAKLGLRIGSNQEDRIRFIKLK